MNDRLSRLVAEWLAHPTGILQSVLISVAWMLTPWLAHFNESRAIFWYLGFCTFISFATQFTIAYQNRKAELALELALKNMTNLMGLVVALTNEIKGGQDDQDNQLAQIESLVSDLDPEELVARFRGVAGGVDSPSAPQDPSGSA